MDAVLNVIASLNKDNEEKPEVAAKAAATGSYKTPLEMTKKALYGVVLNTHSLFRLAILGSLLNDTMFGKFQTTNIGQVIDYDLSDYTKEYTANRLRDIMNVNPGDGGRKPIIISFFDILTNIPNEIIDDILDSLPKAAKEKKGSDISKYITDIQGMSVAPSVSAVLEPSLEANQTTYLDFLKDFANFKIYVEKTPFNEGTGTSNLEFKFAIELDGSLYNEIVDADEFSPYLVYLWVNNSLMNTPRRGVKIIDPRKVVKHKDTILKLNPIRPKTNAEGFCIHGSGTPMYVPRDLDVVEKYMKIANTCVDEDGNFIRNDLVEKHNLANALLYVDWVNDILAYTSPTGILHTFNLGNVCALDKHNEWMFLNTPLSHPNVVRMMRVITESLNALPNPQEAEKYTTSVSAKKVIQTTTPNDLYFSVVSRTATALNMDVTFAHLCGYRIESLFEDHPEVIDRIRALTAMLQHLAVSMQEDKNAIKYPHSMANAGILNRLVGIEYILRAVSRYKHADIQVLHDAYNAEHEKGRLDHDIREFDIPNIMVTDEPGRGLTGLLPHQGLLTTSIMKSPLQSVKAVDTGGGKCLTGEHIVPTSQGLETLEEIHARSGKDLGDGFTRLRHTKVMTRNGLKKANMAYKRTGQTTILYTSDGDFMEGLKDHRIITLQPDFSLDFTQINEAKNKWIPKAIGTNVYPIDNADLRKYREIHDALSHNNINNSKNINFHTRSNFRRPKQMTEGLASLLGYIVAEDYIPEGYTFITITAHEEEIIRDIVSLCKSELNCTPSYIMDGNKTVGVRINGAILVEYLKNILGEGAALSADKTIPHAVRTSTKDVQKAFLTTLFEGDGSVYQSNDRRWGIEYTSISATLKRQLKVMLLNMGIDCNIRTRRMTVSNGNDGNSVMAYALRIAQNSFRKFRDEIGFVSKRKNKKLNDAISWFDTLAEFGQNTNFSVHGKHNKLPCGYAVTNALQLIDSHASKFKSNNYHSITIAKLWRDLGYHLFSRNSDMSKYGEVTNRYAVESFFDLVKNLPYAIKELVMQDEKFIHLLAKIKTISEYVWMKGICVKSGSQKTVYDISVPGPHEYAVQGMMSHNTILTLLASIFGIVNLKTIPMILTKSRLIKGTVTEVNSVCQGKMNVVPFTPLILRRMSRRAGIKTFAQLLKWYKNLPPNTILVSSYTAMASRRRIYEDLPIIDGFGDAPIYSTQFLLIIKLLGIRIMEGDESTMIKNPDSARSRNSYAVFSHADGRSVASGTIVSNTINDLVGQARAISPYIFGDNVELFADTYKISMGIINDESAKIIKDRLRATTAYYQAQKEDWSYMLPLKDDEIKFARMTPLQSEFYDILMQEALLMMLEEEKNKGRKKKQVAEDDDDDDEEDDDDEDEDEDDEDAEDNAFVARAKVHLQKVEAFLVAPDENEQYVRWEKKPSGEDLVSPKVRLADKLISEHLAQFSGNLKQNKIIIFGWNRVASQHFMRWSKYAKQSLHYTAGNEEVVRVFANDPNVHLMTADETSLREGENLQMTSLILRMQSVWAPGDHEQAVARMYRPDPRGRYNRESCRHVWMMNETASGGLTLDGSKMARLTSKFISNARFRYEGRTEWKRVSAEFDELKMIKMNLKLLFETPKEDMIPYWDSWKTFTEWENQLNTASKLSLARRLEQSTGEDLIDDSTGKIRDINQFVRLAMYKVKSTKDIPGSKRVFVPLIPNALPPDPDNWGFHVLGQRDVAVGTVVYTEFGPGIVVGVTKRGAKIQLHDGSKIGFKKGDILLVNPKRYKEFAEIVKNPSRWRDESFSPFGKGKVSAAKPIDDDEEIIDNLDEEDIKDDDTDSDDLEVVTGIINGWPALLIFDDIPKLKQIKGWNRVDPFVSVGFRTWQIAERFLDAIDGKMSISDKTFERLQDEMKMIREGKAMRLGTQIDMSAFRDFFRIQHKKLGRDKQQRIILHPYWISNENEIKLAFDINSHDPKFVSWLIRQGQQQPALKVTKNDAFWINTFTTVREAINDLENLRQLGTIDEAGLKQDLQDVKKEIQLLKRPRSKPRM